MMVEGDASALVDRLLSFVRQRCPWCAFSYLGVAETDILEMYTRNAYPEAYRLLPVHLIEGRGTAAPSVVADVGGAWSGHREWRINEHYLRTRFEQVVDNIARDAGGDIVLDDRICY